MTQRTYESKKKYNKKLKLKSETKENSQDIK